jgi:CubicO group peptidase (beta-lactamase class C family)
MFTPVKEAYQLTFEEYWETGSQLTMYYKGKKVVDLWGKMPEILPTYSNHSLQRVFSSGKLVESLAVAICVDKGLFKLDEPIAKYWSNFAKHGKGEVTIAQLMRHESGLSKFGNKSVTLVELDAYTRGDTEPLARLIEDSPPLWLNTTRRIYHATTRGWILAELIRRVDPQHRLFHEFVREEIAEVLGIDFYFLPANKVADIAPLHKTSTPWVLGTLKAKSFRSH